MPRKKSALTDKQTAYVESRLDGKSQRQSAKEAGYTSDAMAIEAERSQKVRQALSIARSELSTATQIKRADVLEMLMEAYDMAKIMSESSSMTAAAREIGRMLGFYEPETIKLELTPSQANMQHRLRSLSDEELLRIASGTAQIVEGEVLERALN